MEESYGEGLANHTGPESCGCGGDGVSEALTGERAGRVLSPESSGNIVEADALLVCGRPHHLGRHRKTQKNPPGSETFSMYGSSLRETLLRRTDEKLGKLKVLMRLSHELQLISHGQYEEIAVRLFEAGKMLGGWIKSSRSGRPDAS